MANVSVEESYDLIKERKRDLSTNYRGTLVSEVGTTNIIDWQQIFKNKKEVYIYRLSKENKQYIFTGYLKKIKDILQINR